MTRSVRFARRASRFVVAVAGISAVPTLVAAQSTGGRAFATRLERSVATSLSNGRAAIPVLRL